jgi:ribulose-5-phosphate 4-epimerase/fuculose-1-phosphate aldolase
MVTQETEGVIQFAYQLRPPRDRAQARARAEALEALAAPFRRAGLLGRDPARYDGLAYGNVSQREGTGYAITASQRSDQPTLRAEDVCWAALQRGVNGALEAEGDRPPSSESLVHEALYQACPGAQAVVHGHHPALWQARNALAVHGARGAKRHGGPRPGGNRP